MNRVVIVCACIAALPAAASAQVIITEIMYDLAEGSDSGREWIEVRNVGDTQIDLTAWRLFESNSNHKIAGARSLAPGEYAIIADDTAKFRADWPAFSGIIYESAFSLNNDGETIEMRQGTRVVDAVAYESGMGGDGTGDSLQRVESSFMPGSPTPGEPIPTSGLVSAAPEAEASEIASQQIEIIGERPTTDRTLVASAAASSAWQWWLAPFVLSAFASGGFILFRRRKSEEWEIEEME